MEIAVRLRIWLRYVVVVGYADEYADESWWRYDYRRRVDATCVHADPKCRRSFADTSLRPYAAGERRRRPWRVGRRYLIRFGFDLYALNLVIAFVFFNSIITATINLGTPDIGTGTYIRRYG